MLYNTQNFITKEHPSYNPVSQRYERLAYWGDVKRKCIEGMWVGGKWMPGTLYTFANVWHIKMSSEKSIGKILGRPYIRDLEWDKHLNLAEARGFSGFEGDTEETCFRFEQGVRDFGSEALLKIGVPEAFKANGQRKEYVTAREYLRRVHVKGSMGKPQYKNSAMNVIDLESRDCFGKDTEVVMYDGTIKLVQDIVKGDVVMGPDGGPRNVQWTHSGIDDLYKIKPTTGGFDEFVTNSNHKLQVSNYGKHINIRTKIVFKHQSLLQSIKLYKSSIKIKGLTNRSNVQESSFDMEYIGKGEFFGFKLDGDHLFVKSDYVVQHNTGKSYNAGVWIGHNWMFDGAIDYDFYLENKRNKTPLASETLVGAIEAKYSMELLSKATIGLDNLPGSIWFGGEFYPSPLYVPSKGSFKNAEQTVEAKKSASKLIHRTFEKDPLAAAGSRPSLVALEEVGFMNNIEEVLGGLEDTVSDDGRQYGTVYMFGTGGFVKGNSVTHLKKIFENPEDYNCLAFHDQWENRSKKIGYFVPASMAVNRFKEGPNKLTNFTMAEKYWKDRREEMKRSSKEKYFSFIINRPLIPSEIFLVSEGGFFPAADLKDTLTELEYSSTELDANFVGKLEFNEAGEVEFKNDTELEPIRDYPLSKKSLNKVGALEISEKPQKVDGQVPAGTYLLGGDTVDKAVSSTDSLTSVFVMNRFTRRIVAEYTGRTDDPNDFYEMCRKLCLYYNGTLMYEKNLPGLYTYFENRKQTYLLAETPPHLRNTDTYKAGTNTSKGINASGPINETGLRFFKSWMLEKINKSSDVRMLSTIKFPALLKECILYNPDANFDRVSAMCMLMWHDQTQYRAIKTEATKVEKSFLQSNYFKKMGILK